MILITNQYYVTGVEATESGGMLSNDVLANSPAFTQYALESVVGGFGNGPSIDPLSFGATGLALTTGDIALNVVLDALEARGAVMLERAEVAELLLP